MKQIILTVFILTVAVIPAAADDYKLDDGISLFETPVISI